MLLIIDNYDSFTWNIYQYFGILGQKVKVVRNDKTTLKKIEAMDPEYIVLSPGPGIPDQAGITLSVIEEFAGKVPILGICLGHQSIAQAFGGKIVRAKTLMHGKISEVFHQRRGIYKGIKSPVEVTRYHSLVVAPDSLPSCLKITAKTEDGIIMGLRHKRLAVEGIQFHPESWMTQKGMLMLENFLQTN
mgnify:CR=1 FL=1